MLEIWGISAGSKSSMKAFIRAFNGRDIRLEGFSLKDCCNIQLKSLDLRWKSNTIMKDTRCLFNLDIRFLINI